MNGSDIYDLILDIGATSSRTEKEILVKELADDPLGRFVLEWAYNPLITFGLTPPTPVGEPGVVAFDEAVVLPLLKALSQRRVTGNAALEATTLVLNALDMPGAQLLWLILSKDLKCGIAATTINAVMPGLIPVFAVMRAHAYEEKRIKKWPVAVEPKLDGYRYTFICKGGNGGFFSRNGIRQPAADHLVEPMIALALYALQHPITTLDLRHALLEPDAAYKSVFSRDRLNFVVDGEMLVAGNFNDNGALRRQSVVATTARFHIFDIMPLADFDAVGSVGKPYRERRDLVEEFVSFAPVTGPITMTEMVIAQDNDDVIEVYNAHRAAGREGAMVKNLDGLYDKKKSYGWLKLKNEETEDLPIIGFFNGEANTKYERLMGGVIVDRNGVAVRVGGGWSDLQRAELAELWAHDAAILGLRPVIGFKPGYVLSRADLEAHPRRDEFKLLLRLLEVEYHEVTPDGSLRHPRAVRFRDDKAGELEHRDAA